MKKAANNNNSNNGESQTATDKNGEMYIPQAIRKYMSDSDIRRLKDSIDVTREQMCAKDQQQAQNGNNNKKSVRFVTPQAIIATGGDAGGGVNRAGTFDRREAEEGGAAAAARGRPATAEGGINRPKRVFSAGGTYI